MPVSGTTKPKRPTAFERAQYQKPGPKATQRVRRAKGERTWWSDDERVAALVALDLNGGNVGRTATELGIPENTLRQWHHGHRFPEGQRLREESRGRMADAFEALTWQLVALAPAKIDAAPLNHIIGGIDKLTTGTQLLRGLPTSNTESTNRNLNANASLVELLAQATAEERERLRQIIGGIAQRAGSAGGDVPRSDSRPVRGDS